MRIVTIATFVLLVGCASRGPTTRSAAGGEQVFRSPKSAVDALLGACVAQDEGRLLAIFGEQSRGIISAGDPAVDRERCQLLTDAARHTTRLDPKGPNTLQLVVGPDDWAFPIPLVKDSAGWHFDTARGIEEIVRRRVGAGELEAITLCRLYVLAQAEYAARAWGGPRAYAQKLVSSPGKRDGLYWPSRGGRRDASPLGPFEAGAEPGPYGTLRGYRFRILSAQGNAAPGGERSYVVNGRMTRGYALVGYPVGYGTTGIMTFMCGDDGRIYEKDLGDRTAELGSAITEYDPDATWRRVD